MRRKEKNQLIMTDFFNELVNVRLDMKQRVERRLKTIIGIDITYEMLQVLRVLWNSGGKINQQEIANIVNKNKASLTSLIDNLTKRGLVERTEDDADRRNKIIVLTKLGKAYQDKLQPTLSGIYDIEKSGISIDEIASATALLKALRCGTTR
ncbi:MAG: MarR family transcriptional regulator [Chitinophagaceae bacterium]